MDVTLLHEDYADEDMDVIAECSNPGPIGRDTGYTFTNKSGQMIRVIAQEGEPRATAIKRVRKNHGM